MKKQNSEKNITKLGDYLKCNFFKSNNRINNRYNSINVYKNKNSELLIRKRKRKNTTQNIFELINFQELLLNHYKDFKFYYNKYKENKGRDEKIKYIKYDNIVLGKGAFGECFQFRAIDKEDMNFYAGKIIKKEKVSNHKKSLIDEINIQRKFKDNPKVVKVKDYFEDDENVYIILELCKNKSLLDYLKKRGKLTEIESKCFIFQLLQGLKSLHKNKVIHRDLKPNNLLLDDKNELKIGDFGVIAHLNQDNERRHTICGTCSYMAPEIFENNGKGYSFEVDIWSVGIIMYQFLTGKLPFDGKNNEEIQKNILAFQPENLNVSGLSQVAADLIKQILVKNPKKRPGINQIIYHYFFHDTEFPKYITPETLNNIEKEKKEDKKEEEEKEKEKKLKMELHNLIVDDIPDIEYENIKNYVIKESDAVYKYYITYYHQSSHYGFYYYEFNNEIIGMIAKNKEGESIDINMIYNTETKFFYLIKIDENNEDDDEIRRYTIEEIPNQLKNKVNLFLEYYILILKKKKKIEIEDEISSIKEQNNFSQSNKISELFSLSNEDSIISQNRVLDKSNLIYIRNIIVHKRVDILFLSDQTIEAIFKDKIKILISKNNDKIEIINKDNKIIAVSTNNVFQNSNIDFTKRLEFIKDTILKGIKNKWSYKIKENNQN